MFLHLLYRIGCGLIPILPLKFSYGMACLVADIYYSLNRKERGDVVRNLSVIFGNASGQDLKKFRSISRDTFRNFAKYLVDFFRFSKIDAAYIKEHVRMEGLPNLEDTLKNKKGVIILSAHLGNWELGGYVLGKLGYSMNAVVLTHKNNKVNQFFIDQRNIGNFKSIEIGASLRTCYKSLKNNELLALLGDRNFSNSGLETEFFGKLALMPKGPSILSVRTGAAILPVYMVREPNDDYRMIFEKPIYPAAQADEDDEVKNIMKKYLSSIENAIRQYPSQWYVFKYFWEACDAKG